MTSVSTVEGRDFQIPELYYQQSKFFRASSAYQEDPRVRPRSRIRVDFTYDQLSIINIPVGDLDHAELIQSYSVDSYFENQIRMTEAEPRITGFWLGESYCFYEKNDREYIFEIVRDSFFSNPVTATKIFLHGKYRDFTHPIRETIEGDDWDLFDHYRYYHQIEQGILENVSKEDLNLIEIVRFPYDNDRVLRMIERLGGLGDRRVHNPVIQRASNYYDLIHNIIPKGDYNEYLFEWIRYEDLDNPVWNKLYNKIILRAISAREYQPSTLAEAVGNIGSNQRRQYPYSLFQNNDIRVITHVMTFLAANGVIPSNVSDASPAAIELLNLPPSGISRLDSFLHYKNTRLTAYDSDLSEIAWYLIVNDPQRMDIRLIREYLDDIINGTPSWLLDMIANPTNLNLIPMINIYYKDPQLAQILTQLGGDLSGDYESGIPDGFLDILIDHDYKFGNIGVDIIQSIYANSSDYVRRKLELIPPSLEGPIIVPLINIRKLLSLKPDSINERSWIRIIDEINRYLAGEHIRIDKIIKDHLNTRTIDERLVNWNLLDEDIEFLNAIIEYIASINDVNQSTERLLEIIKPIRRELEYLSKSSYRFKPNRVSNREWDKVIEAVNLYTSSNMRPNQVNNSIRSVRDIELLRALLEYVNSEYDNYRRDKYDLVIDSIQKRLQGLVDEHSERQSLARRESIRTSPTIRGRSRRSPTTRRRGRQPSPIRQPSSSSESSEVSSSESSSDELSSYEESSLEE